MKFSSPQQKRVFEFILHFRVENGYDPSYKEIAENLGLSSVSTIAEHVQNLKDKDFLEKEKNSKRDFNIKENTF